LSVLQEVAMKQRLWSSRFEFPKLLRDSVISLSDMVKELAFAVSSDGYIVYAGAVNILDYFEFWDIEVAKAALYLMDRFEILEELLRTNQTGSSISTAIGAELGYDDLTNCAIVYSPYVSGNKMGYVGVLGPSRMNYAKVFPAVKYTKGLVEELSEPW
jgi:heat-inducible transcriptional repressor